MAQTVSVLLLIFATLVLQSWPVRLWPDPTNPRCKVDPNLAPPCPFLRVCPSDVSKARYKAEDRNEGQYGKAAGLKKKMDV